MKLTDIQRDRLTVEGVELDVYVEAPEPLPAQVYLDVLAHYDDETGARKRKDIPVQVPCAPTTPRSNTPGVHAYLVRWTAGLAQEPQLAGRLVLAFYKVRGVSTTTGKMVQSQVSKDFHGIVPIDITRQKALTRIMLHEFASRTMEPNGDIKTEFDPSPLREHLATLTVQQKKLLLRTALENPGGRLVTFITLYPRQQLRMHADWTDRRGGGVVPNATFSVFHCRNEPRTSASPRSTSAITLVCHTRHLVVDVVNPPTLNWITKRRYGDRKPNKWLDKCTNAPVLFRIAALQPSSQTGSVIWNVILEAGTGENIMPGNSLHGQINTKGCWMLFRNFNFPSRRADELDRVYRKIFRPDLGKAAVVAELAKIGYDVKPGDEQPGFSSSYDKFIKYDRNWAYQWFFHEVVGIKYFGDTDHWGDKNTVNEYNVHGLEWSKSFPLSEAGQRPAYNEPDEANYAYYDFKHHQLPVGPNLFRNNAMGFKTANAFAKNMHSKLPLAELAECSWSDVYFFKEDGVDAERMTANDVKEP